MNEPTLSELQAQIARFVEARDWRRFHSAKNLAMSLAIEVAELMEHFQWLSAEEGAAQLDDPAVRAAIADELADVLIYTLSFAQTTEIDPTEAILAKLARNEQRFPPDEVRGRLGTKRGGGHDSSSA
jgi:dCTP diphosphatase